MYVHHGEGLHVEVRVQLCEVCSLLSSRGSQRLNQACRASAFPC